MTRNMKDSEIEWIGDIPINWHSKRNKYLLEWTYSGGTPKSSNNSFYTEEGGIPFVSINDMSSVDYIDTTLRRVTDLGIKDKNLKVLSKGTILYSMYATVGETAELRIKATISQAIIALYIKKGEVYKQFYKYSLTAIKGYVLSSAEGTTQKNLNAEKVKNLVLPVPPLFEQKAIANFLNGKCSKIDEAITTEKKLVERLKEYKQSIINDVIINGLNSNVEIQNSKIGGVKTFPKNWKVERLKFIATSIFKGNGITKEDIRDKGDTPCVRYGEIYTNYNYYFNKCTTNTDHSLVNSPKYFSYGDILFAGTGELITEIGKCIAYTGNQKCLAGGDIIILKHNESPRYMSYLLNASYVQNQKSFGKYKLKVVHISATEIGDILVALPPKNEQNDIADFLDIKCLKIDEAILKSESLINKLEEYKKSLIYEYVTGKREVPMTDER